MKELLEKLDAEHDGRNFDIELIKKPARHPVVITHPETGRKALYVNAGFTRRIAGLSQYESQGILNMLNGHCTRVRYQARVHYEVGTLSIWDNRCVQHCAPPDYGYEERRTPPRRSTMRRTTRLVERVVYARQHSANTGGIDRPSRS